MSVKIWDEIEEIKEKVRIKNIERLLKELVNNDHRRRRH